MTHRAPCRFPWRASAGWLADKIGTESQQIAVSVYTGTFFLMGLSMTGIWCYAQARGYSRASQPEILRAATRFYIFAPVLSGVIFLLSLVSVWASLAVFVLMFVIYVFPSTAIRILARGSDRHERETASAPDVEGEPVAR